jgi:hypothetical protein
MNTAKPKHDPILASNFKVSEYRRARSTEDRDAIADAIQRRFLERYIGPITDSSAKHGFTIMAVSCLMIEALECFRQGWIDTKPRGKGAMASRLFFDTAEPLKDFRGHAQAFYTHVRCGILHQAETTGGWIVSRSGPLFDPNASRINATIFVERVEDFLRAFCSDLKEKEWKSPDWKHVITKMDAIVKNCER